MLLSSESMFLLTLLFLQEWQRPKSDRVLLPHRLPVDSHHSRSRVHAQLLEQREHSNLRDPPSNRPSDRCQSSSQQLRAGERSLAARMAPEISHHHLRWSRHQSHREECQDRDGRSYQAMKTRVAFFFEVNHWEAASFFEVRRALAIKMIAFTIALY